MPKTRQQKNDIVSELSARVKGAKSVVFANFQGLNIKNTDELRTKCREQSAEYMVTKKTLLKKALMEAGCEIDTKTFAGGVSVITAKDEVTAAKIIGEFAKAHDMAKIFGGMLEGKAIDATMVVSLSKLPSKQQLLGQLVGTLNAPISGFVNVLAGNLRGLVNVLNAVKDKKPV